MIEEKIRAKVEDVSITLDDVQGFINALKPEAQAQFNNEEGINRITDELVNQELIYFDAVDQGYDKDPVFVEQLENTKISLLKQYAIAKLFNNIEIKEEELKKYYEDHKEYFKKPMEINASHILVDSVEEAEKAKKRIEEGEDFGKVAMEMSSCPSKDAGGNLGIFTPGKMVKEFDDACQEIEIGKVSDPVKTQFGYHIILVSSRTEPGIISFEEAKPEVKKQISALKQQDVYLNKTKELEKTYKVEKFY